MVAGPAKKAVHGGGGKRQREKTEKNILDFSASINPYPPEIPWECDPFFLEHYPDDTYARLKEIIAATFHTAPEEVCVGNGSIELIRVLCRVVLPCKGSYYTEAPTFGEYAYSAELAGGKRVAGMREADLVFICNPNNPDGSLRSREDMCALAASGVGEKGILCADEAFIELADPDQSLINDMQENILILRSLTKCFSVPGIRFGYGFGSEDLVEKIEASRLPWTVNAFAEAYAIQAFRHLKDLEKSRELIVKERVFLTDALASMGLSCAPSRANYLLLDTGRNVDNLCIMMEKLGILVRNCSSFGLPTKIRVAVRTRDENRCLLEALSACLH